MSRGNSREQNRYQILEKIGEGGMGVVFKAYDRTLERVVALKTLKNFKEEDKKRFFSEAKITASLNHINIAHVYDVDVDHDPLFFTMDYIEEAVPLDEYLKTNRISLKNTILLMEKICQAIGVAHNNNVVHRDIKPSNILIDCHGKPWVTDFGIAKNIASKNNNTKSGMVVGTFNYMSPEQANGKNKHLQKSTDVFSLGVVLYKCLTGHLPFVGPSTLVIMKKLFHDDPTPMKRYNRYIPNELENICLKCMSKTPEKRYTDASQLGNDLLRYLKNKVVLAQPPSFVYRSKKWFITHSKLALTAMITTSIICLFFYQTYFANSVIDVKTFIYEKQTGTRKYIPIKVVFSKEKFVKTSSKSATNISLAPGNYNIKAASDEYVVKQRYNVGAGKRYSLDLELKYKKVLQIDSPLILEGYLPKENRSFSTRRPTSLSSKNKSIVFQKTGYFPLQQKISLTKKHTTYSIELQSRLIWKKKSIFNKQIVGFDIGDHDANGSLDLCYSLSNGSLAAFCLETNRHLWERQSDLLETEEFSSTKWFDYNKDGYLDIVNAHFDRFSLYDGRRKKELHSFPNWWGRSFQITDANLDKYDDFILLGKNSISCISGKDFSILWQHKKLNSYYPQSIAKWRGSIVYTEQGKLHQIHLASGKRNILFDYAKKNNNLHARNVFVVESKNLVYWYQRYAGLYCFDLNQKKLIWHKPHKKEHQGRNAKILVHKGMLWISLDKLYLYNSGNGLLQKTYTTANSTDFNGSNIYLINANEKKSDVILTCSFGNIYLAQSQATKNTTLLKPLFTTKQKVVHTVVVDLDYDGIQEIVFSSGNHLYALEVQRSEEISILKNSCNVERTNRNTAISLSKEKEIFVTSGNESLMILPKTREVVWRFHFKHASHCSPKKFLWRHKAYFVIADGNVLYITDEHAKIITSYKTDSISKLLLEDINSDQIPEIFIVHKNKQSFVSCLQLDMKSVKPKMIWSKKRAVEFLALAKQNGQDVIILREDLFITTLSAKSGQILNTIQIEKSSYNSELNFALIDTNNNGIVDIIAPDEYGIITCTENGQILWRKKISSTRLTNYFAVNKNKNAVHFIIADISQNLFCIDAVTGHILWRKEKVENTNFTIALGKDYNGDLVNDIVCGGRNQTFALYSGRDGLLLYHHGGLGEILFPPFFDHTTNSFLFINEELRLYLIESFPEYLVKKSAKQKLSHPNLQAALLHRSNIFYGLPQVKTMLARHTNLPTFWLSYYRGSILLRESKENEHRTGQLLPVKIKKAREFFYNSSLEKGQLDKNMFLLIGLDLISTQNKQQAMKMLENYLKNDIQSFYKLHQSIMSWLPQTNINNYEKVINQIIAKNNIYKDLENRYALQMIDKQDSSIIIDMILKYGNRKSPNYESYANTYIRKIYRRSLQFRPFFQEKIRDLYQEAQKVISEEKVLLQLRKLLSK